MRSLRLIMLAVCWFGLATPGAVAAEKLVIYSSHPIELITLLVNDFQDQTGIQTEVVTGGTGVLLNSIAEEAANPLGDVIWGGTGDALEAYAPYLLPYLTPEAEAFLNSVRQPDQTFTAFSILPVVLLVHEALGEGTPIVGYGDLLNPALKSRIISGDPRRSGLAATHMMNMLYNMSKGDPEQGWDFVERFMTNLQGRQPALGIPPHEGVVQGTFAVALTMEDACAKAQAQGHPVRIVYMKEGVIAPFDGVAIIRGAKHLASAKAFIDYVSGIRAQNLMVAKLYRRSVRTDVPPVSGLPPLDLLPIFTPDSALIRKHRHEWLHRYGKLLDAAS